MKPWMLPTVIERMRAADARTQRSERNLSSGQHFFTFFKLYRQSDTSEERFDSEEFYVKIATKRLKGGIR